VEVRRVFDIDGFLSDCRSVMTEADPLLAVRDVLKRALARPGLVATALNPTEGGFWVLHRSEGITVVHVVWPAEMVLFPHDHRMWAAIGIYTGQEDNTFYRRDPDDPRRIVSTGGKEVRDGDVLLLGDEAIHAVANPLGRFTAALHVYGGDFVGATRSQWGPGPLEERPYDMELVRQEFARMNAEAYSSGEGQER
jgi:predicted metal-dependent enzyme (double-stranded beta helix superfamily)